LQDFHFSDGGASTVAAACRTSPIPGGSYRAAAGLAGSAAAGSLASLAGASAEGTWQLRVANTGAAAFGYFRDATLYLSSGASVAPYGFGAETRFTSLPSSSGTFKVATTNGHPGATAVANTYYSGTSFLYFPPAGGQPGGATLPIAVSVARAGGCEQATPMAISLQVRAWLRNARACNAAAAGRGF
jgi:hypothetical protein